MARTCSTASRWTTWLTTRGLQRRHPPSGVPWCAHRGSSFSGAGVTPGGQRWARVRRDAGLVGCGVRKAGALRRKTPKWYGCGGCSLQRCMPEGVLVPGPRPQATRASRRARLHTQAAEGRRGQRGDAVAFSISTGWVSVLATARLRELRRRDWAPRGHGVDAVDGGWLEASGGWRVRRNAGRFGAGNPGSAGTL